MTNPQLDELYTGGVHNPVEVGHGGVYTGPLPARQISREFGHEQGAPGVHMRHREEHDLYELMQTTLVNGLSAGALLFMKQLGFLAKSAICFNSSGYDLMLAREYPIPTGVQNYVIALYPTLQSAELTIDGGAQSAASGRVRIVLCESVLAPCPGILPLSWAR